MTKGRVAGTYSGSLQSKTLQSSLDLEKPLLITAKYIFEDRSMCKTML
jgi:hypothetical protein